MSKLSIAGHDLAYTRVGEGPPVVMLHSGGMSSRQWQRLAERLAKRHTVYLPDFLGSGASSPWPDDVFFHASLDVLAIEALLDVIAAPAHLVGHSYGGYVALMCALHRPAAVRSVAAFEPVCFGVLHSKGDDAAPSTDIVETPFTTAEGKEAWLRGFVDYWNGPGGWDRLTEPARAGFRAVALKVFWEVRTLLFDRTPHEAYALVKARTLILSGEVSPIAARTVAAILAEAIPGAEHRTIAGAGHMGPLTHAGAVAEAVEALLQRV